METIKQAPRVYECMECHHRVTIVTNHRMECYPQCAGKCKQYIRTGRGANEQEHVLPKQTVHRFIRDAQ